MARYGRKGRSVTCSYEEIIDFNTVGGSISVMGIHTPDDQTPLKMFPGLFQQFKKWKYLGCKIVGANAAQLPVDPLGVGYEAGEDNQAVADPRDIFDPIMFHGCHGEDLGAVLNRLYTPLHDLSDSLVAFTESEGSDTDLGRSEVLEGLYYKALTDRTWRKFPIQGGIRLRGLHPLVYSLATNHYISPNLQGAEFYDETDGTIDGFDAPNAISNATGVSVNNDTRFFTPRLQRLGWMDTRVPYMPAGNEIPSPSDPDEGYADWQEKLVSTQNYAMMPRIFMGVLLIPKSRRVKQYMRLRIVHYFKFAGFRGASMNVNVLGSPSFFEAESNVGDLDVPSEDDTILGGNPNPDSPDDPTPGPTPPEPVNKYQLAISQNKSSNETVWLQTGSTWGADIVNSKTMNDTSPIYMTDVPEGDYYIYLSPKPNYSTVTLTKGGVSVPLTYVTSGTLTGYKSTNKITVNTNESLVFTYTGVTKGDDKHELQHFEP